MKLTSANIKHSKTLFSHDYASLSLVGNFLKHYKTVYLCHQIINKNNLPKTKIVSWIRDRLG